MKKLLLGIALVFLAACTSLKARDIDYRGKNASTWEASVILDKNPTWKIAVFATLKEKDSKWGYGSCVGIGYDSKTNETYLATADHVIRGDVKYVKQTEGEGQLLKIVRVIKHPRKDIGFLVVNGRLPIIPVYEGVPLSDFDITYGYIDGDLKNKGLKIGQAVPGQSGGAVFSNRHGLYGIVSTTGEAVVIWSALVDLKLEHVTRPN